MQHCERTTLEVHIADGFLRPRLSSDIQNMIQNDNDPTAPSPRPRDGPRQARLSE